MNKIEADYYEQLLKQGFSYETATIVVATTFQKPHLATEVLQQIKEENELLYNAVFPEPEIIRISADAIDPRLKK